MIKETVMTGSPEDTARIFGSFDFNARMIEKVFGVCVRNRSEEDGSDAIEITGEDTETVGAAKRTVECLKQLAAYSDSIPEQTLRYVIDMVKDGREGELLDLSDNCICITTKGKPIKARTVGQKYYVDSIKNNTIIFGIGPAGTGKTFLAVAMAVKALREKQVSRISSQGRLSRRGRSSGSFPATSRAR